MGFIGTVVHVAELRDIFGDILIYLPGLRISTAQCQTIMFQKPPPVFLLDHILDIYPIRQCDMRHEPSPLRATLRNVCVCPSSRGSEKPIFAQ
jgi:hypothetical protein